MQKVIKFSKASQKNQNKKLNPKHFHNNCFYYAVIQGKQAKEDI